MSFNFTLSSIWFEEQCKIYRTFFADSSDIEILAQIKELKKGIDDLSDIDRSLDKYNRLTQLFMALMSRPGRHGDVFECAQMHCERAYFINHANEMGPSHDVDETLCRMLAFYRSTYTAFEFYKMFIMHQFESNFAIADKLRDGTSLTTASMANVAWCYYTGISGFIEVNKPFALYYQYAAYYASQFIYSKDKTIMVHSSRAQRIVSDRLYDMYIELVRSKVPIDIVVEPFEKLRKFRRTKSLWLREREERYVTLSINAIVASKTKMI